MGATPKGHGVLRVRGGAEFVENLGRFDPALEPGGTAVLTLARRIAAEVSIATGKSVQVRGWVGPVIHRSWEYLVETDGTTRLVEVGEGDIRSFHSADYDRAALERRIRGQMRTLVDD